MKQSNKIKLTIAALVLSTGLTLAQTSKWTAMIKTSETKEEPKKETEKIKKDKLKRFEDVIDASATKSFGLFNCFKVSDKYYMEIPDSLLNRDMLVVTRYVQTPAGIKEHRSQHGGELINDQIWQWHRRQNTIFIRVPSYMHINTNNSDIEHALQNSNATPILAAFEIKATNNNGQNYLIDVTDFYNGEIPGMPMPDNLKKTYKLSGTDASRSYIDTIKAFPTNIEVKTVKTFKSPDLPSDKTVGAMTFTLNTSMVLLPKKPMKPRYENARIGYFSNPKIDFGANDHQVKEKAYIHRWRLEPSDEAAYQRGELVKPKKQIVYYIDPATPKKWVPYLIAGVNDWNSAFESAGFKDAIVGREAPTYEENPEFSTEDARYSVIRYFASAKENAYGPRVTDPRSGEIIESHIGWYHNVMSLLQKWLFIQTAAIYPEARGAKLTDEQMGQLIRFVSSHEVGHTLGLLHNFGSSSTYPVDSLRSPSFTEKYGTAPSIMDYARFNYIAQPEDGVKNVYPKIGEYDKFAIDFGYRYFHNTNADQDALYLEKIIQEKIKNPIYYYGKQESMDPRAQSEDLGDDAIKASDYGIQNLKQILPNIEKWTFNAEDNLTNTKDLYLDITNQYKRYVKHVLANVGGMMEDVKTMGEEGPVYTYVTKEKQKRAVDFINRQVFETPYWLLDNTLLSRIDYGVMVTKVVDIQTLALGSLLEAYSLARMLDNELKNNTSAYTVRELLQDVRKQIFNAPSNTTFNRGLQRAYIDQLGSLVNLDKAIGETSHAARGFTPYNPNLSDMRILIMEELQKVKQITYKATKRKSGFEKTHYTELLNRIKKYEK